MKDTNKFSINILILLKYHQVEIKKSLKINNNFMIASNYFLMISLSINDFIKIKNKIN